MTAKGIHWWRFFGELFALVPSEVDGNSCYTSNRWYRHALIRMIAPSEYMSVYLKMNRPDNDNRRD